jgi:hypothetical protein
LTGARFDRQVIALGLTPGLTAVQLHAIASERLTERVEHRAWPWLTQPSPGKRAFKFPQLDLAALKATSTAAAAAGLKAA